MSAFLRAKLKRKIHPVEYVDSSASDDEHLPQPETSSTPEPTASSPGTSCPSTSSVALGFDLMNNFLNNSLSASTKTEYQVCKLSSKHPSFFPPSMYLHILYWKFFRPYFFHSLSNEVVGVTTFVTNTNRYICKTKNFLVTSPVILWQNLIFFYITVIMFILLSLINF